MEITKVYVLTADVTYGLYGSDIRLFGVFSTEERAKKQASKMKLYYYNISCVEIDETKEQLYLGGYNE